MPSILLIEDNEDDYEAVKRSLKQNEFLGSVIWCRNGQEALDYLYQQGAFEHECSVEVPDLILLDLNMPGIDGRAVLRRLKEDPDKRTIPVVVLTTSKDSKDIARCYEIGASTYIQKPVDFNGLTNAIRTMKDYWFGVAILPNQDR